MMNLVKETANRHFFSLHTSTYAMPTRRALVCLPPCLPACLPACLACPTLFVRLGARSCSTHVHPHPNPHTPPPPPPPTPAAPPTSNRRML